MAKSKTKIEVGVFVVLPARPGVVGRVIMAWRRDDGADAARVDWPALRIESDHLASDLAAVDRPGSTTPTERPTPEEPTP